MSKTVFLLTLFWSSLLFGQYIPPEYSSDLLDETQSLSSLERDSILSSISELRATKKIYYAIYLPKSLQGYPIEEVASRVFKKWKLGQAKVDNGLLLVIARSERQIKLEVGYGLEGTLSDSRASLLIDQFIKPYMKKDDLIGAIMGGFQGINRLDDPNLVKINKSWKTKEIFNWQFYLILVSLLYLGLRILKSNSQKLANQILPEKFSAYQKVPFSSGQEISLLWIWRLPFIVLTAILLRTNLEDPSGIQVLIGILVYFLLFYVPHQIVSKLIIASTGPTNSLGSSDDSSTTSEHSNSSYSNNGSSSGGGGASDRY